MEMVFPAELSIEQKGLNKALTPFHNYLPNKQEFTQVLEQDLNFKVFAYFLKSLPEKATHDQYPNLSVNNHVEVSCNMKPWLKWRSTPKTTLSGLPSASFNWM